MSTCRLALKEWAVTVRALDQGRQMVLLRKGGIHEEGAGFHLAGREFLLYPTYEHQRQTLLKPAWREQLHAVSAEAPPAGQVVFSHWARVAEVMQVRSPEELEAMSEHHLWTAEYAEERLHWKPRTPLLVLAVRVYRMGLPQTAPIEPSYGGCKSWVTLAADVELGDLIPVLGEQEFQAEAECIKRKLCGKT